jgi:hypothetical protein
LDAPCNTRERSQRRWWPSGRWAFFDWRVAIRKAHASRRGAATYADQIDMIEKTAPRQRGRRGKRIPATNTLTKN